MVATANAIMMRMLMKMKMMMMIITVICDGMYVVCMACVNYSRCSLVLRRFLDASMLWTNTLKQK